MIKFAQLQMQAKLKIGQPGDKYEQEADRVAKEVMHMPDPQVPQPEEEEKHIQTQPLAREISEAEEVEKGLGPGLAIYPFIR